MDSNRKNGNCYNFLKDPPPPFSLLLYRPSANCNRRINSRSIARCPED
jgi:hypothetical protein